MNEPVTITATVGAWLTSTSSKLETILRQVDADPSEALGNLGYSNLDMDEGSYPWVRIGEAQITVTLFPRNRVVAEQIKVLNNELNAERAKWLTAQQTIMDRISNLQALTNEVES